RRRSRVKSPNKGSSRASSRSTKKLLPNATWGAMSLGEGALKQNQSVMNSFWSLRNLILLLLLVTMLPRLGSAQSPALRPVQLRCDALVNPLGIDSKAPMLSWQLRDARFGARQTAYEIQVASSCEVLTGGEPNVGDGGRIISDQSSGGGYGVGRT